MYNVAMNRRKLFQAITGFVVAPAVLPGKPREEVLHMYEGMWQPGSWSPLAHTWWTMKPSELDAFLDNHKGEYTNVVDLGPESGIDYSLREPG